MSGINNEKLAKLQAQANASGPRRKNAKKIHKAPADDKKLQASLKKLNAQSIPAIDEVNMFMEDGQVLHFESPKVQAAVNANTFVISGEGQEKELTELVPGILPQLGPESLASLVRIAEAYKAHVAAGKNPEDIPELVESLQAAQLKQETA